MHPRMGLINISDKHLKEKPRSVRAVFRFSKRLFPIRLSFYASNTRVIAAHCENKLSISWNRIVVRSVIQSCSMSKTSYDRIMFEQYSLIEIYQNSVYICSLCSRNNELAIMVTDYRDSKLIDKGILGQR